MDAATTQSQPRPSPAQSRSLRCCRTLRAQGPPTRPPLRRDSTTAAPSAHASPPSRVLAHRPARNPRAGTASASTGRARRSSRATGSSPAMKDRPAAENSHRYASHRPTACPSQESARPSRPAPQASPTALRPQAGPARHAAVESQAPRETADARTCLAASRAASILPACSATAADRATVFPGKLPPLPAKTHLQPSRGRRE